METTFAFEMCFSSTIAKMYLYRFLLICITDENELFSSLVETELFCSYFEKYGTCALHPC